MQHKPTVLPDIIDSEHYSIEEMVKAINKLTTYLSTQEEEKEKAYADGYADGIQVVHAGGNVSIEKPEEFSYQKDPTYTRTSNVETVTITPSPQEKGWEKEFENTKFAKGGGLAFECSDYEGMYIELKSFIKKTLTTEREKVREWARERGQVDADNDYEFGRNEVLKELTQWLDHMEG